jgi:6-phosphogluconate dehydrogenase
MQLGMVGLGRMGANMTTRLLRGGHTVAVFDQNAKAVSTAAADGAIGAGSLEALVAQLQAPRAVWVMVPSGEPTEATVTALGALLSAGDTIIDGGNSNYKDSMRRGTTLAAKGVAFIDAGTSGGVWGLKEGYALMIGGDAAAVERLRPIFSTLAPAPDRGWARVGPGGAGHFTKMVHNGIEYGMMQALAEGFDILKNANSQRLPEHERLTLDTADIAEVWRRGSVITSWLLDLTSSALAEDRELASYSGHVDDSGEGRWTVEAAIAEAVPAEVLTSALYTRFRSRQDHTFAEKVLSAMRKGFGGHVEPASPAKSGAAKTPGTAS